MISTSQNILKDKIAEFIRKYYLNKLYKGIVFFVIIMLATYIAFSLFEYYSYSNTHVRTILFYSFLALSIGNIIGYIIFPLLKIYGFGKQLTNEQVAEIIGQHFNEIDDKLLNTLELQKQLERGEYKSLELLSAAIDHKIDSFKTYSFVQAVPVKKTKKFARWIFLPLAIFIILFSIKSELFTESTKRIVHYTEQYEKPAPYQFDVTNGKLLAFQHEDFTVKVKVSGEELPGEVYIKYQNRSFKCVKNSNSEFSYTFTNLQKSTDFQFVTDEVQSVYHTLEVLPKPVTLGFVMQLHYPKYLGKPDEVIDNVGNATVPEGTQIKWVFYTKHSDNLVFILDGKQNVLSSRNDDYIVTQVARNSFTYSIFNKNKYFTSKDTLTDEITVIKDLYPEIYVQSQQDSAFADRYYFKGNIKDDYGFSKLQFVYSRYDANGKKIESGRVVNINYDHNATIQDFYFYFDPNTFALNPGEKIDYYFQVSDNDGVNGHKTSKTNVSTYKVRTMEEIEKDLNQGEKQTKADFADVLKQSEKLAKEIDKLQTQMMQNKELSWQDKKRLEQLMEQYNELQKMVNELKQEQKNQNSLENQYKNLDEDIIKKQKELEKRMDEVLSDEMKQMMQQLQEMMQKTDKNQLQNQMRKMKTNTEDINKSLDQQLQLYKQLEVEKKVKETIQQLRDLSLEQQQNASQTSDKAVTKEYLQKQQEKIQKKFEEIKKDIDEIQQLNKQLEDPNKINSTDELQKEIDQQLQQSMQNLEKNNRSKSSQNQSKAAEDMEKVANQMEKDINESELESVSEDIETLRQILDNLVKISFEQESVLDLTQRTNPRSSNVTAIMTRQHKVKANMKMIEDSLNALARRQMSVKPFIQGEISKIQDHLTSSQNDLNERKLSNATKNQQFVLTSMNNLALMLNESMKEMQKKKSECKSKCKKSGNGSCSKPGGSGKSKKASARELQQQLNRQMEAMKRSMEQNGQQGQSGQQQKMSEQFAKMAAQQEAIRKMLQEYNNAQKAQNGVGDKSLEQLIEDMKKTEKELVNRQITQQTLQRQQSITTRLLQSERADQQREKEEERKSTEALPVNRLNPPRNWSFDKEKTQQNEMLKSVPANLNYYYKEKANAYFYNID